MPRDDALVDEDGSHHGAGSQEDAPDNPVAAKSAEKRQAPAKGLVGDHQHCRDEDKEDHGNHFEHVPLLGVLVNQRRRRTGFLQLLAGLCGQECHRHQPQRQHTQGPRQVAPPAPDQGIDDGAQAGDGPEYDYGVDKQDMGRKPTNFDQVKTPPKHGATGSDAGAADPLRGRDSYDSSMGSRELAGIAGQLYALPYGEFVAARTAAAKDIGRPGVTPAAQRALAAEVRALPKPSLAAWAVNMLAAHHPDILRDLAELGDAMQAAQAALDAAGLRRLAQDRRRLLTGAVAAARVLATERGRAISAAVATEVEQTLRAATADPGAAAAVQSGCLLRSLSADGVDVVDLTGAVAVPGSPAGGEPGSSAAQGRPDGGAAVGSSETPRRVEPPGAAAGGAAGARPSAEKPLLRAVGGARTAPSPSAVQRARSGLQLAEESAAAANEEERRAAAELAAAAAETTRLADEALDLRRRLDLAEAGLKEARKRHQLAAAMAQQTARAAERQRRQEVLARERVLRLSNTPEA